MSEPLSMLVDVGRLTIAVGDFSYTSSTVGYAKRVKRLITMEDTDGARADVCLRLMSLDRGDYEAVLKECFLPECVIDNDDIWLNGRANIKKALAFTTAICSASGMVGDPIWDESKSTVTYQYFRQLKLGFRVTQITTLHLTPTRSEDEGSTRYWVSKIGDRHVNMPWTAWPVLGHLHLYIVRPLFSWMIVGISTLFLSSPNRSSRFQATKRSS